MLWGSHSAAAAITYLLGATGVLSAGQGSGKPSLGLGPHCSCFG